MSLTACHPFSFAFTFPFILPWVIPQIIGISSPLAWPPFTITNTSTRRLILRTITNLMIQIPTSPASIRTESTVSMIISMRRSFGRNMSSGRSFLRRSNFRSQGLRLRSVGIRIYIENIRMRRNRSGSIG